MFGVAHVVLHGTSARVALYRTWIEMCIKLTSGDASSDLAATELASQPLPFGLTHGMTRRNFSLACDFPHGLGPESHTEDKGQQ